MKHVIESTKIMPLYKPSRYILSGMILLLIAGAAGLCLWDVVQSFLK